MTDMYASFLTPLLPLFVSEFGLSLAMAGMLSAVFSTISSVVQPLVGHISDTWKNRAFAVLGPMIAAGAMGAIGMATRPAILLTLLVVGGIGCAMFHPQGAAMSGSADPARRGFALSAFATAGEAGYALGPLVVLSVLSTLGRRYTLLTAAPGLLASFLIYRFGPPVRTGTPDPSGYSDPADCGRNGRDRVAPLIVLWLVAVLRIFVVMCFATFIPLYLDQIGLPLVEYAMAASLFAFSGTLGTMAGGPLADWLGAPQFLVVALLAPIPFLWGFLNTSGFVSYALLAIGGVILYSPAAVTTVAAQELAPDRAGMASALMMGVAWGAGSLGVAGAGAIADGLGIRLTLMLLLGALVVAAALALVFRSLIRSARGKE